MNAFIWPILVSDLASSLGMTMAHSSTCTVCDHATPVQCPNALSHTWQHVHLHAHVSCRSCTETQIQAALNLSAASHYAILFAHHHMQTNTHIHKHARTHKYIHTSAHTHKYTLCHYHMPSSIIFYS